MNTKSEHHITSDEMLGYLSSTVANEEFFRLADKMDSHISGCAECRKRYQELLAATEELEKMVTFIPKSEKLKFSIFKGLYYFESEINEGKAKVGDCLSLMEDFSFSIRLKVNGFTELAYENLVGQRQYYHPVFATALKAYGEESQEGEVLSTLVDEDKNRITIGPDRTLSLFFNRDECFSDSIVLLIPENDSAQPHFEYAKDYDDHTMVVRFEDVDEGEYIVAMKE